MAIGTPVNRGSAQLDTSQATLPVTTTGAVASGSKIILSVGWRTATTLSSVAGGGLTWTIDRQIVNAGATQHAALVSADAPSGLASGTVITLTFSANTSAKIVSVEEVTGLAAQGSAFDKNATNDQASNATAFTTGTTATTAQADELLMAVGFMGVIQTGAPTWTNSFTARTTLSSPTRSLVTGYRIVAATGTYAGTATLTTTSTWQSLIGTYKAAAGGASITGSASLTGTGTSTTNGFASKTDAAAITGAGTLSATGIVTRSGTAALAGAGTTSATGVRKVSGSASLTMLGSSLETGYTSRFAQASLTGTGVLSATAVPNLPIIDTFTRTRASDWGMSDSGHLWVGQADSGAAVQASVDGAQGVQVIDRSTTAYRREYVAVNNTDVEALFRACFTALPATGVSTLGVNLRLAPPPAATTSYYLCELRLSLAAALTTRIDVVNAGSATTIAAAVTVTSSYVAGDFYWIRFQCVGSTIRCRVWKDGTTEPSTWTRTATNSLVANGVRVALFNYPSVGTGTANAKYDDVLIAQASLGAAALTGAGSASASGVRMRSGAAALAGAGTLTATGVRTRSGTAALTGAGTLAATGTKTRLGTASLAGAGTLAATGTKTRLGATGLAGNGTLAATGRRTVIGSAVLTRAVSTLSATGTSFTPGVASADLAAAGSLSATGRLTRTSPAALVASSSLVATGRLTRTGQALLAATGTLSTSGVATTVVYGTANLAGQGTLSAAGAVVTVIHGEAHLTTAGVASVTGYRTVYGSASLVTPDPVPPVIIETVGGGGPVLRIDLQKVGSEAHLFGLGSLHATGSASVVLVDDEEALRLAVELLL